MPELTYNEYLPEPTNADVVSSPSMIDFVTSMYQTKQISHVHGWNAEELAIFAKRLTAQCPTTQLDIKKFGFWTGKFWLFMHSEVLTREEVFDELAYSLYIALLMALTVVRSTDHTEKILPRLHRHVDERLRDMHLVKYEGLLLAPPQYHCPKPEAPSNDEPRLEELDDFLSSSSDEADCAD